MPVNSEKEMMNVISEFYLVSSPSGYLETLNDLLGVFISEARKSEFKGHYIADTVFQVSAISNFIVKLKEEFDKETETDKQASQ